MQSNDIPEAFVAYKRAENDDEMIIFRMVFKEKAPAAYPCDDLSDHRARTKRKRIDFE